MTKSKNWIFLLLMLCGVVLGSFLGHLTKDISWLSWLDYGLDFGIGKGDGTSPFVAELGILSLTFGLTIKISIASILGVVTAFFVYKKCIK